MNLVVVGGEMDRQSLRNVCMKRPDRQRDIRVPSSEERADPDTQIWVHCMILSRVSKAEET